MQSLNILSDGMGSWGFGVTDPLLNIAFPSVNITHDQSKKADLVVLSHFRHIENRPFDCPYITWSGESFRVKAEETPPLCEINSFDCDDSSSIYFPLLVLESKSVRPTTLAQDKKYCAAFAFSNPVHARELIFRGLRQREPSCYAFGPSCFTPDNPFHLPNNQRSNNASAFKDFAFAVAMENKVQSGYITEKIGMAFESGTVPIYDSRNGVQRFFNLGSFFDVSHFDTTEKACETIVEIWKDKKKLQRFFDSPVRANKELEKYENLRVEWPWMKPFIVALRDQFPDL